MTDNTCLAQSMNGSTRCKNTSRGGPRCAHRRHRKNSRDPDRKTPFSLTAAAVSARHLLVGTAARIEKAMNAGK